MSWGRPCTSRLTEMLIMLDMTSACNCGSISGGGGQQAHHLRLSSTFVSRPQKFAKEKRNINVDSSLIVALRIRLTCVRRAHVSIMQLLAVLCCFSVIVANCAPATDNSSQRKDGGSIALGSSVKKMVAQDGNVTPEPGHLARLLVRALRNSSEHSQGAELPEKEVQSEAGSDKATDGDPRSKRSPHRHYRGCFSCGHGGGGGGYYIQPVYPKPIYIETVYIKPVEYVQPVYHKPIYSHPHYGSGCSTCGGSFSYSQSSASSSSYSYGYGKK